MRSRLADNSLIRRWTVLHSIAENERVSARWQFLAVAELLSNSRHARIYSWRAAYLDCTNVAWIVLFRLLRVRGPTSRPGDPNWSQRGARRHSAVLRSTSGFVKPGSAPRRRRPRPRAPNAAAASAPWPFSWWQPAMECTHWIDPRAACCWIGAKWQGRTSFCCAHSRKRNRQHGHTPDSRLRRPVLDYISTNITLECTIA